MYLILSPTKIPATLTSSSSLKDSSTVFLQKQKELLNMFTSGLASFNYCLTEMYKVGKQQGERKCR
jgi:hypothetical protein